MWRRLLFLGHLLGDHGRATCEAASNGWNRFWFTPVDPSTLCLIRIFAGAMLLYSHAVWTLDLAAFFGESSWLSSEVQQHAARDGYGWSLLTWCRSPISLWLFHGVALISFTCLMLGLWTRVAAIASFVAIVSYAHRVPAALFGLDQINGLLALYLIIGPSGSRYSLDAWRLRRETLVCQKSVAAGISIRLMQCHLCVIYLFAGLSKLQGLTWWTGQAVWGGVANQEYQTLDLTGLADWPLLVAAMTHATVAWELSYCVLIWNRWTRPVMLLGAVAVHLGIALALGMPTFGLAMLIVNVSFISPSVIQTLISGERSSNDRKPLSNVARRMVPHHG